MLSKQDLISLSNAATYYKGEQYFQQQRILSLTNENGFIEAKVQGSTPNKRYNVSFTFRHQGRGLDFCWCDCPAFTEYDGVCKHVIAVVLTIQGAVPFEQSRIKLSDNSASKMLNQYLQGIATIAEVSSANVVLEPVLELNCGLAAAFFRVGAQRRYIVPDLMQFKENFKNASKAFYGKFEFVHVLAAFVDSSKPLVEFFLSRYDEYNRLYQNEHLTSYANVQKRKMYLRPFMVDELLGLLVGQRLAVREHVHNDEVKLLVEQRDFRPRLRLIKNADGARLILVNRVQLLLGEFKLYILTADCIYCCSQEFSAACTDLLQSLEAHAGKLFFAQTDLGMLFSAVILRVHPFIDLELEGDFSQYQLLPLVVKIYLDTPAADNITGRMTFNYGETELSAFASDKVTVVRDLKKELLAKNLLTAYFNGEPDQQGLLLIKDDPDAVYHLVAEGLEELAQVAEIYTTDSFRKIKIRHQAGVTVGVRVDSGLLKLNIDLSEIQLSELPDILASYRLAKKYYRLRDGSFLMLEQNALGCLSELAEGIDLSAKELSSGQVTLTMNRALYIDTICKQNEELRIERDRSFKKILRDMREVENSDFSVPLELRKVLRNYQKTGFRWLKTIAAYGFGGVLADDMGLGKTLQVLALLQSYHEENHEGLPAIVVCPSSLVLNWESEAKRFTPELSTLVISGAAVEREQALSCIKDHDLVITSYDSLKRDVQFYAELSFAFIITDEAQYIKNQITQNAKTVKALQGQVRLALTGTPVENSLAELWSIFDFIMPGYLFNYSRFKKKFELPIVKDGSKEAAERLRQIISPFLLRRIKRDVLKELPPKTESVIRVSMELEQQQLYLANLAQARTDLAQQAGFTNGKGRIKILAALTRMRQVCCDPSLIYEDYAGGSAKLQACMELVETCIKAGHRLLLFSQFTSMLDRIAKQLTMRDIMYWRIDGATKPSQRLALVNTFNTDTTPVFLISLKAGGTGLNLTGADVVIHYDPWWNLSVQNQATDRAHRIGQKNNVQVYKLIVKDTVEEQIVLLQEKKADLANQLLTENIDPFERLTQEELLALFDYSCQ